MLVAVQEPVPLLNRMPVVMAVALVIALLALGILLLLMLFRSVCASPLLLSVRHPAYLALPGGVQGDPEIKQGGRQGCYMSNSLSSVFLFCWSKGLTCCFAGESTTVQKPRRTTALSPCEDVEEVQYEQRPCMPYLDRLSVKSTGRVLTGSVRSLQAL